MQKSISYLPGPEKINYLFQKYVTRGVDLTDAYFGQKILHAKDHLNYLNKYGRKREENVILELGTGWYPIIPVVFYLADGGRIISIDIHNWVRKENQLRTFRKFEEWRTRGLLDDHISAINEDKWRKLLELIRDAADDGIEQINDTIGLKCLQQDARALELGDNSIDFICSNNTLEHIDREYLDPILREFVRILKPAGVMSHFIDMSDHFAHRDGKITVHNFLRYSEKQWRIIDNRIQPQNRLRFVDYKRLYRIIGIPITEELVIDQNKMELDKIRIHEEYASYTREELAITHGYLVSRMP